jgi:hypothetical protein
MCLVLSYMYYTYIAAIRILYHNIWGGGATENYKFTIENP